MDVRSARYLPGKKLRSRGIAFSDQTLLCREEICDGSHLGHGCG